MYIQSEPYWINRVCPLFDQPDLKGHMKFHFLAPQEWSIISNTNIDKNSKAQEFCKGSDHTEFEKAVIDKYGDSFGEENNYWSFNRT